MLSALTVQNGSHQWMKTLLAAAAVFVCFCILFVHTSEAKGKLHHLTHIESTVTEVDGRAALRVEIAVKGAGLIYSLSPQAHEDNQLLIELEDVTFDKNFPREVAFDGKTAEKLTVIPRENRRAALRIDAGQSLVRADAYRIYTIPEDTQAKTPERLVIELFADGGNVFGSAAVQGHAVVIDPGHGGSDTGAIGFSGVCEKDVALAVALRTEKLLRAAGAQVIMTRTEDTDVSYAGDSAVHELQARVDVGRNHPEAELFLSIHCNSFTNPDAHGMETYYYPKTDADERFATLLNEELAAAGGLYNRGVKYANFYVMRHSPMPASLVELGFLSNPQEEALLGGAEYQETMAQAIFRAIVRYFE